MSATERDKRDKEEFGYLVRHLLHAAAAAVPSEQAQA